MNKLPDLMSEFNGMMSAMELDDCSEQQRLDMLRAFLGGALIAAKARGDQEMVGHLSIFMRAHV